MPEYLIRHAKGQHGDILIGDPDLRVTVRPGWLVCTERGEIVLAVPSEQVASIQRIDGQPSETEAQPA